MARVRYYRELMVYALAMALGALLCMLGVAFSCGNLKPGTPKRLLLFPDCSATWSGWTLVAMLNLSSGSTRQPCTLLDQREHTTPLLPTPQPSPVAALPSMAGFYRLHAWGGLHQLELGFCKSSSKPIQQPPLIGEKYYLMIEFRIAGKAFGPICSRAVAAG